MKTTQMNIPWLIPTDIGIVQPSQQIMLQPNKEISLAEFHDTFILDIYGLKGIYYSSEFIEWSGDIAVNWQDRGCLWSTHYFWFCGYGLAASVAHAYATQKEARMRVGLGKVEKQDGYKNRKIMFKYFRIGCEHSMTERGTAMFENIWKCTKCGYTIATDSSG